MKLYFYPGACSLVAHIALEETGADYECELVDIVAGAQHRPAYLRVNPAAQVPALETPRGIITQVPAILGYLAQSYPHAGLAPVEDPFAFAQAQAFHIYIATTLHVLFRQISRPDAFADGELAHAALKRKVPAMADHYFRPIEQQLSDGRSWVHGERFSASDIYLYVFASYLNLGDRGDPAGIPAIWSHRRRVRARPAVARALAAEQGGALVTLFD